jgi:multiple sugar transport system ATP-binding protein
MTAKSRRTGERCTVPSSGLSLDLLGVTKFYGHVRAVENLSFSVPDGRFFALFGPSAVGKTTSLRSIAGLVTPDSGSIMIGGKDMTRAAIAGRGVSMVFQTFALYPHLTVYDNLAYPLREEGVASSEIDARVKAQAEKLRISHRLERKPSTLSGGEQQRVALGRSLIRRPRVLLLDEPLTNLDAKLRNEMRAELKRLHREYGMTIVYATPDELEALSMGEEIGVMRDGAIVQRGTPDEIYDRPDSLYVAAKIGAPIINTMSATLTADDAVETPIGTFKIAARKNGHKEIGPDGAVLAIRPNDIRIAVGEKDAIATRVHLLEPLGDITVVSLEAQGVEPIRIVLPEAQAIGMKPGDAVPVAFDTNRIHLFRASDGTAIR